MSQPRLLWDILYTLAEKGPISKRQVSMEQGQFCRIPDVLTFEQGHFLHALPRASILPCPPLWHPACRAPDVIWARTFFAWVATGLHFALSTTVAPCMQDTWCLDIWARTFFFCMGCHGPPIEYKLYIYTYIYIYWILFLLYIYNIYIFYTVYIYIDIYIFWLWHSTVGKLENIS